MLAERWEFHKNHSQYLISDKGKVKSLKKGFYYGKNLVPRLLKRGRGYLRVGLQVNVGLTVDNGIEKIKPKTPKNRNKPISWNIDKAISLFKSGLNYNQISKELGIHRASVQDALIRRGYKRSVYNRSVSHTTKQHLFLIHRLVAETFLGSAPHGKPHVNHKDGNPQNNCVENLEWVNRSENIQHALKSGFFKTKITRSIANLIRLWAGMGIPQSHISDFFGISQSGVSRINNRLSWR